MHKVFLFVLCILFFTAGYLFSENREYFLSYYTIKNHSISMLSSTLYGYDNIEDIKVNPEKYINKEVKVSGKCVRYLLGIQTDNYRFYNGIMDNEGFSIPILPRNDRHIEINKHYVIHGYVKKMVKTFRNFEYNSKSELIYSENQNVIYYIEEK